jgi:hypothetical protein
MGGSQMRGVKQLILLIIVNLCLAKEAIIPNHQGLAFEYSTGNNLLFKDSLVFLDTGYVATMYSPDEKFRWQRIHILRSMSCNYSFIYTQFDSLYLGIESKRISQVPIVNGVLNFSKSEGQDGWSMHHNYGDTAQKQWTASSNQDTSRANSLWKSPSWGGPQYEFKETWVRGLGLVSMEYLPNYMDMSGVYHFKTTGLPANPCNPNYENYHLSLITHGTDTLYDASKVVTPVQNPLPAGLRLEQGLAQIPSAWLNPKQTLSVTWLSANGQSQDLSWKQNAKYLSVQIPPQLKQGWIRVAQGQNWRVYRVLNSH